MSGINLSQAVRSSLTSLQSTADLLANTQERLATGNRVNSALDDPTAFFTATALNDRASDLSTLLDEQGQAIQVIRAADDGISAIQDLVATARAIANQALQTDNATERGTLAAQYDAILGQIEDLAADASFNGTNLLDSVNSQDLQVVFNEDGSSTLTVLGVNFTDTTDVNGLNLQRVSTAGTPAIPGTPAVPATNAALDLSTGSGNDIDFAAITAGDELTIDVGGESVTVTFASAPADADALAAAITSAIGSSGITGNLTATNNGGTLELRSSTGDISITTNDADTSGSFGAGGQTTVGGADGTAFVAAIPAVPDTPAGAATGFATNQDINDTLAAIDAALGTLRTTAATLGTNLSTIQIRSDFTQNLINTLEVGAGNLTLADLNEEGANLLTLQTRQQLASTSLSFATQADQAVLSLFG